MDDQILSSSRSGASSLIMAEERVICACDRAPFWRRISTIPRNVKLKSPLPRKTQDQLGNVATPYRALYEKGGSLMCTHALDGTLLSINPAASNLFGYEPSELIGKNLAIGIPPSGRKLFYDYLSRIKAVGMDQGFLRLSTKDGGKRLLLYSNVLHNPGGSEAPFILGSALDLTTLKAAEQERLKEQFAQKEQVEDVLRATRERLSAVVQNAPVILFAMDATGYYTLAEGKALSDLPEHKRRWVGKSVFDVFADYP
jgi:PAS domain S-box-containing protein